MKEREKGTREREGEVEKRERERRKEEERERGGGGGRVMRVSRSLSLAGLSALHRLLCVLADKYPESLYAPQIPIVAEMILSCLPESDSFSLMDLMIAR